MSCHPVLHPSHLNFDAIFPLRLGQIGREVDPRLVLVHRPLKAALETHLEAILGDKMNLTVRLGKLFYKSSIGIPALLP